MLVKIGLWATSLWVLLAAGCASELNQCLEEDACGPCEVCVAGACEAVSEPCGDAVDVTGLWNVVETITGNCQGSEYPYVIGYIVDAVQNGATASFDMPGAAEPVSATVSGYRIGWSAARDTDSGVLSIVFSGAVTADATRMTGTGQWTYTRDTYECSGTADVVATRVLPGTCQGVQCGDGGLCTLDTSDQPVCGCGAGYDADDLRCEPNACHDVTCSDAGTCLMVGGEPTCDCFLGYEPDGLTCVLQSTDCDGVTCSNHGTCVVEVAGPRCDCNGGYHAEGLACVSDVSPCEGVDCGEGSCVVLGPNATCDCSSGYHPVGLSCVADAPPFCVATATELHEALVAAGDSEQPDTIQIVQGTYDGTFVYYSTKAHALTIEGGYTSDCADRQVDAANTALSAKNSGSALSLTSPAAADFQVDALTMQDGLATAGGGLYVSTAGNATVTRNVITENWAGDGGGLFVTGAALVTVTDNTITDNVFTEYHGNGGGIHLTDITEAVIARNIVSGNNNNPDAPVGEYSLGDGGGIFVGSSFGSSRAIDAVTITGNLVSNNEAGVGGGIAVTLAVADDEYGAVINRAVIANNIVHDNLADGLAGYEGSSGGGVRVEGVAELSLFENTIVNNTAGQQGGGLRLVMYRNTQKADVHNNIIWNNSAPDQGADIDIENDGNGDTVRSEVSLLCNDFDRTVPSGFQTTIAVSPDSSNLANVDPQFEDATAGLFNLVTEDVTESPCVDACGKNGVPDEDFDGVARPVGTGYDMGALEQVSQ